LKRNESFCFFFQKEALFFFKKKNQKTFLPDPMRAQRRNIIVSGMSGAR
jgi:hypothetical protein